MTKNRKFGLPIVPAPLQNHGNYIISLNKFIRWFGEQVEQSGVDIFSGFAGADLLIEGDKVVGVRTGDKGLDKRGNKKGNFEPGIDIRAKLTILAEGSRGSLTKQLVKTFALDRDRNPQVYTVGVKEVWDVPKEKQTGGRVIHTMGWPLRNEEFGGGFIYNMADGRVSIGLVVGLDYHDPRLDPHERFQEYKTHPYIRSLLEGGTLVFVRRKDDSRGWLLGTAAVLLQRWTDHWRCGRVFECHAAEGNSSRFQDRYACRTGCE